MDLFVSLILGCHLLAVNLATAGPLLAIGLEWKEGRSDALAGRVGRGLMQASLWSLLLGVVLGLLVGWYLWSSGLSEAVQRLPSKVHFGVWEIVFSLILMAAHAGWWAARPQAHPLVRVVRSLMALLASTNLMYHFPVLFAVMSELIHHNNQTGAVIAAGEFRQLLMSGAVLARAVHAALASLAVAGLYSAMYAMFRLPAPEEERQRLSAWGARWALATTLAQLPVGLWLVTRVPPSAQRAIMGQDVLAAGLFGVALVLVLWLCHLLAALAVGDTTRAKLRQAAVAMITVVLLMTAVSQRIFRSAGNGDAPAAIELPARTDRTTVMVDSAVLPPFANTEAQ